MSRIISDNLSETTGSIIEKFSNMTERVDVLENIIVDILKTVKDTHPDLIIKYLDVIRKNNEHQK